ncbi:BTB/POZ domain protein [Aspergillus terreus]|uniref:BTB/POZ domain protein n=1 Tax=Aspergillus terreus TaxID=33178 RepID=A0A5M3ZDW1_ASPTE|nr:hypothetical protein ATETN484_0017011200 [Aspergillus terreus]GFF21783.1 BTB/POZ domain protein [Aspergillus terreus]
MAQAPKTGTKRKATKSPSNCPAAKLGRIARGFHLPDRYSDLTIVCGDREFPAHRLVVCPQSEYFARACDGKFKESSGRIEIHDTDPILVEKTLDFIYTGDNTPGLTNYVPPRLASPSPDREKDESSEEAAFEPEASEVLLVETEPANHEPAKDEQAEEVTSNDKIPESEKAEGPKGTDDMAQFEPCFHVLMHEQAHYFQIQGLRMKARDHFRRTFLAGEPAQEPLVAVIYQVYQSSPVWDTLKGVVFATIINKAESVYKCEPRVIPPRSSGRFPTLGKTWPMRH